MSMSNNKINVVLAGRPKMMSEVLRKMIQKQPDMDVATEVYDPIELLIIIKQTPADVAIITPVNPTTKTKICKRLLQEFPLLKILTISADGKRAVLYQNDRTDVHIMEPSEAGICNTIRKSLR